MHRHGPLASQRGTDRPDARVWSLLARPRTTRQTSHAQHGCSRTPSDSSRWFPERCPRNANGL
eukprot:5977301-Prymnesium_polylepis.2